MPNPPRVVLAHHDLLTRDLMRLVCASQEIYVVAETDSFPELLGLCAAERPGVALTADRLDGEQLDDHLAALLATGAQVVVLTDDPSPERITSLLARGVAGYLLHDTAPEQVAEAVRAVDAGAAALHPTAAAMLLQQWRALRAGTSSGLQPRATLTNREREILGAMADGLATKQIARRLGVAPKTIENHKIRIFDKLGVNNQAHAVSVAIGQGVLAGVVTTAGTGRPEEDG